MNRDKLMLSGRVQHTIERSRKLSIIMSVIPFGEKRRERHTAPGDLVSLGVRAPVKVSLEPVCYVKLRAAFRILLYN